MIRCQMNEKCVGWWFDLILNGSLFSSRLFKKEVGINFVDYLTRIQTRKSIELLCQNDMKIYEIAERVGYSSQHYFSSVFKKEMGMSPIDYRKNVLSNETRMK